MMAVVGAARGEARAIGLIGPGIEEAPPLPIAADAVALEIAQMGAQGRGAKALTEMAHDAGGDDDAAGRREETRAAETVLPAPEACARRGWLAARRAEMAGFLGGAQHLVDKALGPRRAGIAGLAGADAEIAVALGHGAAFRGCLAPLCRAAH